MYLECTSRDLGVGLHFSVHVYLLQTHTHGLYAIENALVIKRSLFLWYRKYDYIKDRPLILKFV